jgi:hypothetical protein
MEKKQKDAQVQAAKITAFQAIVVTLITVAGGSLGYFFGDAGKAKNKPEIKQHWLAIENVNYTGPARLVVTVNGNNFSYPSTQIWAGNGEQAPQERFPLPVGAEKYQISFTALVPEIDPGLKGFYPTKSPHEEEIGLQQLPTGERTVSFIPNASHSTQVKPMIHIKYSVK